MSTTTNLLTETIDYLQRRGLAPSDVLWVGSHDGTLAMGWDDFARIADVEYYSGYGAQEVASDLVVVGDGWWLERYEYDGSERWEIKRPPFLRRTASPFRKVSGGSWANLAELQHKDDDT